MTSLGPGPELGAIPKWTSLNRSDLSPTKQTDRQARLKTLPSCKLRMLVVITWSVWTMAFMKRYFSHSFCLSQKRNFNRTLCLSWNVILTGLCVRPWNVILTVFIFLYFQVRFSSSFSNVACRSVVLSDRDVTSVRSVSITLQTFTPRSQSTIANTKTETISAMSSGFIGKIHLNLLQT